MLLYTASNRGRNVIDVTLVDIIDTYRKEGSLGFCFVRIVLIVDVKDRLLLRYYSL